MSLSSTPTPTPATKPHSRRSSSRSKTDDLWAVSARTTHTRLGQSGSLGRRRHLIVRGRLGKARHGPPRTHPNEDDDDNRGPRSVRQSSLSFFGRSRTSPCGGSPRAVTFRNRIRAARSTFLCGHETEPAHPSSITGRTTPTPSLHPSPSARGREMELRIALRNALNERSPSLPRTSP